MIAPEDDDYDRARTVFLGGIDRRPSVIVRVANAGDVSHVVRLANETGLELAVRSGGHSSAGHGVTEGGIVLDLGDMRALEFDGRRTAWAETGLTAGEYTTAAGAHGLATGFGDTGSVGVGRHHARRRHRLPRPQVRPHDRRPARRRGRDGRRAAPARRRREPSRSVLGDPWRRRQLRRGDPLQVPPARGAHDRRRPVVPPGDARRHRRVHGRGGERARGALHDRERDAGPADAVPARGCGRQAGDLRDVDLRGRRRVGRARRRAVPGVGHAARRPGQADDVSRDVHARGGGVPPHRRRADGVRRRDRTGSDRGDRRAPRGLHRDDERGAAPRARRCDGAGAGRRDRVRPPDEADHGDGGVAVRTAGGPGSEPGLGRRRCRRSCSEAIPRRTSTSSPTRARSGSATPTLARRGGDSPRSSAGTTPRTCSGSTRTSRRRPAEAGRRGVLSVPPSPR